MLWEREGADIVILDKRDEWMRRWVETEMKQAWNSAVIYCWCWAPGLCFRLGILFLVKRLLHRGCGVCDFRELRWDSEWCSV